MVLKSGISRPVSADQLERCVAPRAPAADSTAPGSGTRRCRSSAEWPGDTAGRPVSGGLGPARSPVATRSSASVDERHRRAVPDSLPQSSRPVAQEIRDGSAFGPAIDVAAHHQLHQPDAHSDTRTERVFTQSRVAASQAPADDDASSPMRSRHRGGVAPGVCTTRCTNCSFATTGRTSRRVEIRLPHAAGQLVEPPSSARPQRLSR